MRNKADECYSYAEGYGCFIYVFVCLIVAVYTRVLPFWIDSLHLLAVRPELNPINLVSLSFIISKKSH